MTSDDKIKPIISFPESRNSDWRVVLPIKLKEVKGRKIEIDCRDWLLSCRDARKLISICERLNIEIDSIKSSVIQTVISFTSLGHRSNLNIESDEKNLPSPKETDFQEKNLPKVLFHKGTLRSGEHLEADGDVLLLGDVNPGAKISAGGDVMVWGRLRGTAHAGKSGNKNSKIIALQLRPLQLRIADQVARGPQEKPEEGLAEEAIIESGRILIKPARTSALII